ncbi:type II toxin-antitoxin system RelE/ParE family toxin [Rhizobium sp. B230/85]|nr:type II toxin-antitoxin system RelE/ParE family toxin [Rhizobium sp. B209b/85]QXZ94815.1 type II toxin-antitoxin system RelE/ParE family toxin [Rhizobium sp. B230/85]
MKSPLPSQTSSLCQRFRFIAFWEAQESNSARARIRLSAVGRYLILYREDVDGVEIVRVVHGARDLPKLV